MAGKIGKAVSGHHRRSSDASVAMPTVEFGCEKRNRCFRAAIGDERVVCLLLEIRIVQVNISNAMSLGRQHHQAPIIGNQRFNLINQGEMTKMVGAELSFEAVDRLSERSCYHTRVDYAGFEPPTVSQQSISADPNALQGCK